MHDGKQIRIYTVYKQSQFWHYITEVSKIMNVNSSLFAMNNLVREQKNMWLF